MTLTYSRFAINRTTDQLVCEKCGHDNEDASLYETPFLHRIVVECRFQDETLLDGGVCFCRGTTHQAIAA